MQTPTNGKGADVNNLLVDPGPASNGEERFDTLFRGPGGLFVERIVSHGHTTPEGMWYDMDHDEWVLVLEGEAVLGFEDGTDKRLYKGDQCFLPRGLRHRVEYTSSPCLWLAVHGELIPHVK